MQTKLTLRIEDELIQRAKSYSQETGKSISQLVADYFALLPQQEGEEELELTPIVRSLYGILKGHDLDEEDYHRHLEEKYS